MIIPVLEIEMVVGGFGSLTTDDAPAPVPANI